MGKFNVLWIDDAPKRCKREQKYLENAIKKNSLTPNIEILSKVRKEYLLQEGQDSNEKLKSREYDLLLIDYNLSDNLMGGEVISTVREQYNIYTDIIFYSADRAGLIKSVKASFDKSSSLSFLDNVNIIPLDDDFEIKVDKVVDKIVQSWYNAHSIRGVLLSKVSKFELLISEIIMKNYQDYVEELRGCLIKKGNDVQTATKGKWQIVSTIEGPVSYVINDPINFNWAVKEKILKYLVESNIVKLDKETMGLIKYLFMKRNDFAHNPVKIERGMCFLLKGDTREPYDSDKILKLRKELAIVESKLEEILKK